MKRRVLSVLLAASMVLQLMSGAVFATGTESAGSAGSASSGSSESAVELLYSGTCGDDLTWTITSDGVLTISGTGPMYDYGDGKSAPWSVSADQTYRVGEIVVEEGVTTLGNYAFSNLHHADRVSLPEGLISLGDYAFQNCDDLTYVTLPSTVTELGKGLFYDCDCLVQLDLSKTSLTELSYNMMDSCGRLQTVKLPDTLEYVSAAAFSHSGLQYIELPDSVTGLGWDAFTYTDITSIRVPAGVTSIGLDCFRWAERLETIVFSGDVPSVGTRAFDAAGSSVEGGLTVYYPAGNETWTEEAMAVFGTGISFCAYEGGSCGEEAFWRCADGTLTIYGSGAMADYDEETAPPWYDFCGEITRVVVEDGLTAVGDRAFSWLYCAEEMVLPAGLTSLGDYALYGCDSLTEVTLPASLKTVGFCALAGLNGVEAFAVATGNGAFSVEDGVLFSADGKTLVQAPTGKFASGDSPELLSARSVEEGGEAYAVPDGVETIGPGAFFGCYGLRSITLPAGLKSIERSAFEECYGLYDVEFSDGLEHIGARAFASGNLSVVRFPAGLEEIGSEAFEYFYGTMLFRGEPPVIAEDAFLNASLRIYHPGEGWTDAASADYGAESLTWVNVEDLQGEDAGMVWSLDPDSGLLTLSGEGAMPDYGGDTAAPWGEHGDCITAVEMDGLTCVGSYAFADCYNLKRVVLSEETETIRADAFNSCYDLEQVTIPAAVTEIGDGAFQNCGLAQVEFLGSAPTFGDGAFGWVYALAYYPADDASWTQEVFDCCETLAWVKKGGQPGGTCGAGLIWTLDLTTGVLTVSGEGAMYDYSWEEEAPWASYSQWMTSAVLEEGVTHVGSCAFYNGWELVSVSLPSTVTAIGAEAFSGCPLDEVSLPAGLTQLGAGAFEYCDQLKTITLPAGITQIADNLFRGCNELKSVTMQGAVTSIGDAAFTYCYALESMDLPDSLIAIGTGAFESCSLLKKITLPAGVTQLPDNLFYGCGALETVTMQGEVTAIGERAFSRCHGLTELALPASMTSLGEYAFCGCSSLKEITLPAGITTVSQGLFEQCGALERVSLLGEVTQIGAYAFYSCAKLDLEIPATATTLGKYAFAYSGLTMAEIPNGVTTLPHSLLRGCSKLQEVTVPASVTMVEEYAFANSALKEITFLGGPPYITSSSFAGVTATAYYNADGYYWSASKKANYGGTLTWEVYAPHSGTCGAGLSWVFDEDTGVLTISGDGAMWDVYEIDVPWYKFRESITAVVFTGAVTHIGRYAFAGCTGLKAVEIPGSVTSLGDYAFFRSGLESVTLPAAAATLGQQALGSCRALTGIEVEGENAAFSGVDGVLFNKAGTALLQYPDGRTETTYAIPDGVTQVASYAFYGNRTLTEVSFPASLTTLDSYSFESCSALERVDLSGTAVRSVNGVFRYCTALSWADLSGTEIYDLYQTFAGCTGLRGLILPEGLSGLYGLGDCTGLEYLVITGDKMPDMTSTDEIGSADVRVFYPRGMDVPTDSSWNWFDLSPYIICEDRSYFPFSAADYETAEELASHMGGHLAVVTDMEEDLLIRGLAEETGTEGFRLGGRRSGNDWTWPTGEAWNFTRWSGEEPAAEGDGVYLTAAGWSAVGAAEELPFLVELPAGEDDWSEGDLSDGVLTLDKWGRITGVIGAPTQITIPAQIGGVDVVGLCPGVLNACAALAEVTVEEGHAAFSARDGLLYSADGKTLLFCPAAVGAEVTLPESLRTVASEAFANCAGLECIRFTGDAPTVAEDMLDGCDAVLYYPEGRYGWTTPTWNGFAALPYELDSPVAHFLVEGGSVSYDKTTGQIVGYSAAPTLVYLPAEVNGVAITGIAAGAFADCTSLTGIYVPVTVTSIGEDAFSGCTATLYGGSGSAAQSWAAEAGMDFVSCAVKDVTPATRSSVGGDSLSLTLRLTNSRVDVPVELICTDGEGEFCSVDYTVSKKIASGYRVYTFAVDLTALETGEYTVTLGSGDYGAQTVVVYDVDRTPPAPVEGLTVTPGALVNVVAWNRAAEANATSYRLFRAQSADGDFELLTTLTGRDNLYYNDKAVEAGTEYFYAISAVDTFGQVGERCVPVGGIPQADDEPPHISAITPANGSTLHGTVQIAVTAQDNVKVASITLETSPDGVEWSEPETCITDGQAVFTLDTSGWAEAVSIRVSAADEAGNVGYAAAVYQYAVDNTPPARVTGLWGESSSTIITLHWEDVPDQDFSHFLVEEKKADGSYAFVSRVTATLGVNLTGLAPNTSHTYRVRAVDKVGNAGDWSEEVTVATQTDTIAPVISSISPASKRVNGLLSLRFGVSDDYGVASLTVQTSRDGKVWADAGTVSVDRVATSQSVGCTLDTTALEEGLIYVRAVATDLAGNVGDSSETAPFHQYYIDRTPPAAPTGVTAVGGDGTITVQWEQGGEQDLYTYFVYRAQTKEGEYTQAASGLRQLYWTDNSVTYGSTYYYKVAVQDQAGNLSGQSACTSAQPEPDVTAPTLVSVSPSEGYALSATTTIRAKVHDNNRVATLFYAYRADGGAWQEGSVSVNAADTTLSVPVPLAELDCTDLAVKVWCVDMAGNLSQTVERSYTLDKTAPAVPELTVDVQDMTAVLTWTGGTEADLAGYRIYRAAGQGGSYQYLVQRSGGSDRYTYADTDVSLNTAYSYQLEAIDRSGNTARGEASAFVIPVDRDGQAPRAVIEGSRVGTTGVELAFRGIGSSDNVGIDTYRWDFGDGTGSSLHSPAHAYAQAGTYTVTLTVTDAAGNSDQASLEVVVKDPVAMGTLRVTVTDENGAPLPNAGVYLDLGSEEQCIVYTNTRGVATMTAVEGEHVVGVYTTGYLPAKDTVNIIANATVERTISVVEKDLVVGELTVHRMTLEEIRAAGINVDDPANQEVFEYTIQLTYGAYQETVKTYYNWTGTPLSDPPYLSLTDSNGEKRNVTLNLVSTNRSGSVSYSPVEEPPLVVVLDLPGSASWLKDFFEVRLTVLNQAEEAFVLDNCVADLDLPAGLTLMDTNYTSASTRCAMGSIPGQSSKSAYWVIRGDKAGDYDLSADFTAVLRDFGNTINATFTTASPFTVRQNRGLTLDVVAENAILADTDGAIRVGLRNDDSEPYYLPNVRLDEELVEWVDTFKTRGRVTVDTDMETLFPGETLWSDYIIPRANWETLTYWEGEDFYLLDAIVKATGGTTTLPYTIEEVMPFTIAADLITVSRVDAGGNESDITYINARKDSIFSAEIPDLMVRTYRLNADHQYEPCSMEVLIRDGYQDKDRDGEGRTVTTNADGEYRLAGYTVETLENDKSYTIRVSARRARPVEIPVVIRGDSAPTGNLTVYLYEQTEEGNVPVVGAQVSVTGTGLSELTGEKGGVAFTYVDKGKQEVAISAPGYFPLTELVEVKDDETELYFCLTRDLNPDASCITKVSNTMSAQTQGNRVVIPEGRVKGSIELFFNTRIADGERFSRYRYRILRDNQVAESGEFTSDTFLLKLETMQAGDVLQFALETLREEQVVLSPYVDCGVIFVPAPSAFEDLVYTLAQVSSGSKQDLTLKGSETLEFLPKKHTQSFKQVPISMEKIPNTNLSENGKLLTKEVSKVTMTQRDASWKFKPKAKYDLSGKLTISAELGNYGEGWRDQHTVTAKRYTEVPYTMSMVRHDASQVDISDKFSVGLELVMQYDSGKNDWDAKLYLTQGGEVEMEVAKITVLGVGLLKLEGKLNEAFKWALVETGVGVNETLEVLSNGLVPKSGEIGLEIKGAIGVQAGTDKLASADVYAKAGVTVKFFPNLKGLFSAAIGGEASFLIWNGEKDFIQEEWEASLAADSSPISLSQMFSEEGTELVLPAPGENTAWTGAACGTLLTEAYGQVRPRMVQLPDGTALLVWEDYTGEALNPLALYWARFDGESWSRPARVDGDGTVDLYPDLIATETGAQLVWVDFSQPLTEELASLTYAEVEEQAGKLLSVSVASFDGASGTWTEQTALEETGLAVRPAIALDRSGRTVVAWLGNEAGLAEGTAEEPDCVGWAILEEGAVSLRGTAQLPVSSGMELDLGCGTSGLRLAVLAADEGESARVYESFLRSDGWTTLEPAHNMDGGDEAMCVGGDGALYVISSGCLYRKNTGTMERLLSSPWLSENAAGLTWSRTEQGAALFWTASGETGSTLLVCRVDQDGQIFQPAVLLREEGLLASPTAAQLENGLWLIHRQGTLTQSGWSSDLHIRKVDAGVDLALETDKVSHSSYLIPGACVTTCAEVTSLGLTSPGAFELIVAADPAGDEVIASTRSAHGMTAALEWTVPADYAGETLYLLAEPVDETDGNRENNVLPLTNVVREVAIGQTYYVGRMEGTDRFTTRVENLGLVDSGTLTLTVLSGEEETLVHQTAVDPLAAGTSRVLTLELEPLDEAEKRDLTFVLSVEGWEEDISDNRDTLLLREAAEEPAGVIVTDHFWLDGADQAVDAVPEGIVRARLKLENLGGEECRTSLVLAAYDKDGRQLTVWMESVSLDGGAEGELVCSLDLTGLEAAQVKAFLLDGTSIPVTAFDPLQA